MTDQLPHRRGQAPTDRTREAFSIRPTPTIVSVASGAASVLILSVSDGWFLQPYIQLQNWATGDMMIGRVAFVIIGGLLGFIMGWLWSGRNPILRALLFGPLQGTILYVIVADQGVLGWGTAGIAAIVAFFSGLGYWAHQFVERLRETPTTFGSAAWAKFDELVLKGMITLEGFRLGFTRDDKGVLHPLGYGGDRHIGTVAPNRSGKGTCSIIPNLLTYPGSVMVIDPKGENAMITAHQRKLKGQAVHIVDPWNITGMDTACFNPIDWLKAGDIDISDNAMLLADAIIMMNG
ncbi:MAG: type IV secretory system conjugative DNA transfer family protein, partial [Pseudomonadota bacterium]